MATPVGKTPKDPDLYTASGDGSGKKDLLGGTGPSVGGAKKKVPSLLWQDSTFSGGEDNAPSLEDTPDGFGSKGLLGERLRSENLVDLRRGGSKEKDPLERRLEATVNSIFQKRKLEESRSIAAEYGLSEGDSFSIQCWGDKQCNIPATCFTTFLCRWLCCCCSRCVSKSTEYERLDKYLISQECTTSYDDLAKELTTYVPGWLANLYLHIQNPHFTPSTMLSREEVLELKQGFFDIPSTPWIGVAPLLEAVNVMRIATEAATILYEKQLVDPIWKHWSLYRKRQNAVEQVSECMFLGENLTLELVASWLLVLPTGNEDFSGKGAMRRMYAMLCATIAANMNLTPGMELDPIMVLGVLLAILKEHGVVLTPKDNLIKLAFDCSVGKALPKISLEMQRRSLALLRRALNSRYHRWWDYFNNTKTEQPLPDISVESSSSCCGGCAPSPCCKKGEKDEDPASIPLTAVVTEQPQAMSGSYTSLISTGGKGHSLKSRLQSPGMTGLPLGYKLQLLGRGNTQRPTDEDDGQVSDDSSDG